MRASKLHSTLAALMLCSTAVHAAGNDNLLTRPDLEFVEKQSVGMGLSGVFRIKDGDEGTGTKLETSAATPTELVFTFAGTTVTPSSVRLQVAALADDTAKIEILGSELGPDTGYVSLRTEPMRGSDNWQSFRFEPVAAKWIMIKITPFGEDAAFELRELEINGHEGPPVSEYAFNEAPGDALAVLQSLQGAGVPLDIHPDEQTMFEDAADGQFDQIGFAEASLLSSGVYEPNQRREILAEIDTLTEMARAKTEGQSTFEKGQTLLTFLHEGSMKQGYVELQTDTSEVITTGAYNCVSSATLYNIIARRLGMDVRGIEVPDHAFTILYDGTDHVDVETTTIQGFNPARNRAGLNDFARTTGFTYINDKNRSKRREIGDAGMVALTYYNHGVTATKENDYPKALLHYFRALSLDPDNKSAIKNTMFVLGQWSNEAFEQNNYPRAIEILNAALQFAPSDRSMRHNMRYALTNAMISAQSDAERLKLAALSKELHTRTDDKSFLRIETQALTHRAYAAAERGEFEAALTLTSVSPDNTRAGKDVAKLRRSLYLNWANELLENENYAEAIDILERANNELGRDYRVRNNIAFTLQEWGAAVAKVEGTPAAQAVLQKQAERFPDIRAVQSMLARNYDVDAQAAFDAKQYEDAIAIYQSAYQLGIDERRMKKNELAMWSTWGLERLDEGDFAGALAVFERGLEVHPSERGFKQNVAFIVQEWSKAIVQSDGVLKAEEAIAAHRARFEDISALKRMQGRFINEAVNAAKTPEDFAKVAPFLVPSQRFATSTSKYDKMVAYFYQEWARTQAPELDTDQAITILQPGVDAFPDNRSLRKLFVSVVNKVGAEAFNAQDWPRAMSLYRSAGRSLPGERSFAKAIGEIEEQL